MVTTTDTGAARPETQQKNAGADNHVGKVDQHKTEVKGASEKGYAEVEKDLRTGANSTAARSDACVASNNQNGVLTGQQAIEQASTANPANPGDPSQLKGTDRAAFIAANRDNPQALADAGLLDGNEQKILQDLRDKGNGQVNLDSLKFDKNTGQLLDPSKIDCSTPTGVAAFDGGRLQPGQNPDDLRGGEDPKSDQTKLAAKTEKRQVTQGEGETITAAKGGDGRTEDGEEPVTNPHRTDGTVQTVGRSQLASSESDLYTTDPTQQARTDTRVVQTAARGQDGALETSMDVASAGGVRRRNDQTVQVGRDAGSQPVEASDRSATSGDAPRTSAEALQRMEQAGWIKRGADGQWQAGDHFTSQAAKDNFAKQFNQFLGRQDVSDAQKASVINSTQQLLEDHNNAGGVSDGRRQELATSMMENLAQGKADQGNSNRCNVTEIGNATYTVAPDVAAARTANIIHNGAWVIPADQSSTGQEQRIDMSDAIARLNRGGNLLDNRSGETNLHSELDQIAMAKQYNQARGMIYSVGDPTGPNDTGERLTYRDGSAVRDANGKPIHSPNMTMADVADAAKSKEFGIADRVTVVADKTWQNGRNSRNLNVVDKNDPSQLQGVMDGVRQRGMSTGQSQYVIFGVAGNDRTVVDQNGRADAGSAGPHAGHAIGMVFDPTARSRDGSTQGSFIGRNSWGEKSDKIWDQNVVNANGSVNIANLTRATDMSIDRTRSGPQLQRSPDGVAPHPYHEWHDSHPAVDDRRGGTIQRSTVEQDEQTRKAKEIEEQHKKEDQDDKQKKPKETKKADADTEDDPTKDQTRRTAQADLSRLQAEEARIIAQIHSGIADTASLYPKLADIYSRMESDRNVA